MKNIVRIMILVMCGVAFVAAPGYSETGKAPKAKGKVASKIEAKAEATSEAAEATPTPALTPTVKLNGFVQFWTQNFNNSWDQLLKHTRLKATALMDPDTTVVIMPDMSTGGFTLLDAYVSRNLGDQWSVMAGQYKPAFGDDKYLTPAQLKRVDYAKMDSFAFGSFPLKAWDMGFEFKKVAEEWTIQAGLIQGAGPNATKDSDQTKDLNARVEYKTKEFAVGASYYGGTANTPTFATFQNWGGVHLRYNSEGFDARAEAIFAPFNKNAYFGQVAYKTGDWEPLAWGELGTINSNQAYDVLGLGLNYWPAAKTRLSFNVVMNGVTDLNGPAMTVLQVEQVF